MFLDPNTLQFDPYPCNINFTSGNVKKLALAHIVRKSNNLFVL